MTNKLTELLGIKCPIIQGGMAYVSDAALAAAVSNAGGAGVIALGGRDADWARAQIRKAKSLTDKTFGVNIALIEPNVKELVQAVCEEKPAFAATGAGNPVPWIDAFHRAGIKVMPVVPSVKLARRVEDAGADALVIEGMEAGGHIGTLTTMALMSNVIPQITKIPVVAGGGIADGRALAAALVMGAAGVQIGSRFLISAESPAHPKAKEKIIGATDTDSAVTGFSRKAGVRGLKNAFTEKFLRLETSGAPIEELNALSTGTNRLALIEGDVDNGFVQAGQSLNLLTKIQPCAEIIAEIMSDARKILSDAPKIALY
ncbi:MAG: nitronate monooxygenase [Acidaminococcales bacterium]|jgi:enoyl-[acyl-carrier protein] reductase II|nr:nitronate monooxygenase [Acidaminococcales bacterium]